MQSVLDDDDGHLLFRGHLQDLQYLQRGPGQAADLGDQEDVALVRVGQQCADLTAAPADPAGHAVLDDSIRLDAVSLAIFSNAVLLIGGILGIGGDPQVGGNGQICPPWKKQTRLAIEVTELCQVFLIFLLAGIGKEKRWLSLYITSVGGGVVF